MKINTLYQIHTCAFLTEHYAIKAYWGVEVQLHSFFALGTRWR